MALGELNCPSLDYVYRMTWAEFQLRLISFNRIEKRKSAELRQLCYFAGINLDTKKVRKPSDLWTVYEDEGKLSKGSKPSEAAIKAFNEEMRKYNEKVNGRT